jgi:stearoyl-CoA 9-desaturase NADPH oxidoreductase
MPETGARPNVPRLQRGLLRAIETLTTPLLPSDYLELINPLWSTRELRGRIERVEPETADAATVVIKPGYRWDGHRPGQYLRIGVDVKGVRHWRAYSLTSAANRADGRISITVKHVDEGVVSPYLVRHGRVGAIVSLGGVEGDFVLPDDPPEQLLFISAGSGITPIMSMLRSIRPQDAVLLHSARGAHDVIFGGELREYADRHDGFRLIERDTTSEGRLEPEHLDELVGDWRERETFLSGPGEMLDACCEHWERHGDPSKLHMERFQPKLGLSGEEGEGGTVVFLKSDCEVEADGSTPILVAGEEAGLKLPYGCREGICHTCVGTLKSGRLRDLRNGKVYGNDGETVRTCISAPEGRVEIEL